MRRRSVILFAVVGAAVIGAAVVLPLLRDAAIGMLLPPPGVMYPPAPAMPAPVAESAESLLARYEKILADRAPAVLASLQPGLTEAQIAELEAKHAIQLTPDLRALYRWRNGEKPGTVLTAFPDHHFIPLDGALAERDTVRQQVKAQTPAQQKTYAAYAGHRDPWISVIVDAAGDGHFYDSQRTEAQGSFFFCFAEDGSYTFYPAFRNYLAAVVEGVESGVFTFGAYGAETLDFVKAQALWERFGAANDQQLTED